MIRLEISVEDIDNVIANNYTVVRVYTNSASTSADFTTLDGTVTLVANQQGYTYVDTDGGTSTWYKVAYYGATPGESSQAPAGGYQGGAVTYYCTSLEIRQRLVAGQDDDAAEGTHDDEIIWDVIDGVTRFIDRYKRVEPGGYAASGSETRYYHGSGTTWQEIDPATSVSEVAVEETDGTYTTWTADTDYFTWPYNQSGQTEPIRGLEVNLKSGSTKSVWTHGQKRVKVTGVFGISATVPPDVREAAVALSTRVYKSAMQGYQDASASVEFGQLLYAQAFHPSIKAMLDRAFPHTGAGI